MWLDIKYEWINEPARKQVVIAKIDFYNFYRASEREEIKRILRIRVHQFISCHTNECFLACMQLVIFTSPLRIFQISTPTGVVSHFVNLQVVVPEAFILGSGELHVDMGSAINLVCIIEKVIKSHTHIIYEMLTTYNIWTHTMNRHKTGFKTALDVDKIGSRSKGRQNTQLHFHIDVKRMR